MRYRLKKYLFTGLFVTLPLFISGYVLFVVFRFIDSILGRLINIYFQRNFGIYIPGLGFILFFLCIIAVGFVSTHLFGRSMHRLTDRIGRKFPLIRHIYPSVKQIFEMLFPSEKAEARKIVIIEYPRQGIWSLGFVASEDFKEVKEKTGQDLLSVYVPSVPNPATGNFVFVPRKGANLLNISMKDAIRLIVSGGLLNPSGLSEEQKKPFEAGSPPPYRTKEKVMVSLEEFKKIELRIGRIKEVQDHPNADKLYVLIVEIGDKTKQIVAGIRGSYKKEDLPGRLIVVIDNLEPAVLRGVESQAMLLAASDETGIAILGPDREIKTGGVVK